MRLCLVNYEYPPVGAGAASATKAIAESLTCLGHEVVVVTAGIGEIVGQRVENGVRIIRLRCRRQRADRASLTEMLSFVSSAWRCLPTIVRELKCDGMVCFFSLPCGPVALSTWRKTGVPYVISLRGGDVPGLEQSINWLHQLFAPLRRAVLANAIEIVANSEGLRAASEAADPFPVHVIPNGVDTQTFRPGTAAGRNGAFRVLAVGRLQEQKNHAFAVRVLASLKSVLPQEVEYHVVGDGALRPKLEQLAEQLGFAKQVFWHGWVPRENLAEIYRSCDCLLHPTLYEGMPNVVLEAMATGLPVVASDVAGNRDIVRERETGYVCGLEDERCFRDALSALATDPVLRRRLGSRANMLVRSEYSWETASKRYLNIFSRSAADAGHGGLRNRSVQT